VPEAGFHLAQPAWLWLLLAPIPVAVWLWRSAVKAARGPIHRYADPHLLPHLTGTRELKARERWGQFLYWSLLWAVLIFAMTGPRWDYEQRPLFQVGNNLMILLDISRSMQVEDVAPSRLARARQEIADLTLLNREVRLGLIAFASVPHVISPISDDSAAIRNSLPALSADLTELQGSRLLPALARAESMLEGLPEESSGSVLLISDGDFDEPGLIARAAELAERGIALHVLGVGTSDGGQVPGRRGEWLLDRSGQPVRSGLDAGLLRDLASAGGGLYREASYRQEDSKAILKAAATSRLPANLGEQRARIWNERFYLPVLVVAMLVLARFAPRSSPRRFDERP